MDSREGSRPCGGSSIGARRARRRARPQARAPLPAAYRRQRAAPKSSPPPRGVARSSSQMTRSPDMTRRSSMCSIGAPSAPRLPSWSRRASSTWPNKCCQRSRSCLCFGWRRHSAEPLDARPTLTFEWFSLLLGAALDNENPSVRKRMLLEILTAPDREHGTGGGVGLPLPLDVFDARWCAATLFLGACDDASLYSARGDASENPAANGAERGDAVQEALASFMRRCARDQPLSHYPLSSVSSPTFHHASPTRPACSSIPLSRHSRGPRSCAYSPVPCSRARDLPWRSSRTCARWLSSHCALRVRSSRCLCSATTSSLRLGSRSALTSPRSTSA